MSIRTQSSKKLWYKRVFIYLSVGILSIVITILVSRIVNAQQSVMQSKSSGDTSARYKSQLNTPRKLTAAEQMAASLVLSQNTRSDTDTPVTKNILVIDFNPIVKSVNQRLNVVMGWNDSNTLLTQFMTDLNKNSGGYVNYQIYQHQVIDDYPVKIDGFKYTDSTYSSCVNSGGSLCHSPDTMDYLKILSQYNVCELRNSGTIDEVWFFGGPWFGYWEANMAGLNAFGTNGPAFTVGTSCNKNLNIMGFNYERGNNEMLEDMIHRFEGTMKHVNNGWKNNPYSGSYVLDPPPYSNWDKYTFISAYATSSDLTAYGVGTVHYPPNISNLSNTYNWTSLNSVTSNSDDWYNFPNMTGVTTNLNCNIWGCTEYSYKTWWLNHIPRYLGNSADGRYNNWWKYVVDYDNSYIPTCNQQPQVILLSPVNNYGYPSNTTRVTLSVNAVFNTCNGYREREIWVRDVTLNQSYNELCYYSNDTGDTTFSCGYSGLTNHTYEWLAVAKNESFATASTSWSFVIANLTPTPTPTPVKDTTPPNVSVTNPKNNSSVTHSTNVTISATATDNVGVTKVQFYINSTLAATATTSPYKYIWKVPSGKRITYKITAKAFDAAGNTSLSSISVESK